MVSGELYLIVQNYKWVCMDSTLTRTLTPEVLQGVPITYHTHLYHEDGTAFTAQDLADKYWYMTMYITDALGNTKCVLASSEYRVTGSDLYLQFTYMNTTELVEGFENDGDPQDTLTCSVQVDYDFSGDSSDSTEIGQCLGFGRFKAKLIHRYECDGDSVNPVTPPGGGGTTDYNALRNKPTINGVTVEGDLTSEDLGITFTQVQANWDESDSTAVSYILNKPVIPDAQVQVDWDESDSTSVRHILNKPHIPVDPVQANWDESDSEALSYIQNKPHIPVDPVQANWDESDSEALSYIQNKPHIPVDPVQANWDESDSTDLAYIQNKPSIPDPQVPADWDQSDSAAVDYIKNKPTIPEAPVQADWDESDSANLSYIQNKPTIPQPIPQEQADWDESDSASPAYIQNKPTIPAAQVQVDWDESDTDSVEYIKNKPVIPEAPVQSNWEESDSTDLAYIQNKPTIPQPVPQEQANWDESDSAALSYIQNKPQINGVTLTGNKTAADLGLLSAEGQTITASGVAITPVHDAVYRHTLAANDAITIDTTGLSSSVQVTFELHLIQPATAVTFTLPAGVWWSNGDSFASGNSAPTLDTENTLYCLVFRWDGANLLGNLAYSRGVTA